ncbi:hypothetical protein [Sphingomonas jatrophae]|uniref:Uncharacterized protein n=1 Tax=Sphingomonas jatrophae TaxID=1166337 RepID=A0A1I6L458_9SPHN|nr:hypothetical protein [Sphingomonas jatrophae]SFR98040.1 hypothetical protein SAMN05192580_2240 [Sphingomonas jatrophae]
MTLEQEAARIGAVRAGAVAARIAAAAEAQAGVSADVTGAEVRLSARGLHRRRIDEPLLRVPGALA